MHSILSNLSLCLSSLRSESGNVFFTLVGAVAVVGAIGAGSVTLLKGPVSTAVQINQKTMVESRAELGLKLMTKAAIETDANCDSDGTLEALPWRAGSGPIGGGLLPDDIDTTTTDPWGSEIGYCTWDHGTAVDDAACGGAGQLRLPGLNTTTHAGGVIGGQVFIAAVSAGPDRIFQTTCRDWASADINGGSEDGDLDDAGDLPLVSKPSTSDDIIFTYTYDGTRAAMGDYWVFGADSSASPTDTVLGISNNIELSQDVTFGGLLDLDKLGGGLILPDAGGATCDGTTEGQLFRDVSVDPPAVVICNSGSFEGVSGSASVSATGGNPTDFDPEKANCVANNGGPFVEVANASTPSDSNGVWSDGSYIYVAARGNGLRVYELDGTTLTQLDDAATTRAEFVWGDGNYIYLNDFTAGWKVFSFDGTTLTQLDSEPVTAGAASSIWGDGNYIYMGESAGGNLRAFTFDGSSLTEIGSTTGFASALWGDGTYLYKATGGAGMIAYTFSSGSGFNQIGPTYDTAGSANGVWGDDSYIYVADGNNGLLAMTFDGFSFTEVASIAVAGDARKVWSDGVYIYVTSTTSGVLAYSFDGSEFTLVDTIDTSDSHVWGDGTYIYTVGGAQLKAYSGFECTRANADTASTVTDVNTENDRNIIAYGAGSDDLGQLGDGGSDDASVGTFSELDVRNVNGSFKKISVWDTISCGLTHDGSAYCWGEEYLGRVGNGVGGIIGQTTGRPEPVLISEDIKFKDITVESHSCALSEDDKVYCWGYCAIFGQCGSTVTGSSVLQPTDTGITGFNFKKLGLGEVHSCGLTETGKVYCWGRNVFGQLGIEETGDKNTPHPVYGINNFIDLSVGFRVGCGVTDTGEAYCWGWETEGQLGNGDTNGNQTLPQRVYGVDDLIQISVGRQHVCAVDKDGVAWCWGRGDEGQLGNGSNVDAWVPVQVSDITDFVKVVALYDFSCGITSDQKLYCWGDAAEGQYGDGVNTASNVPLEITTVSNVIDISDGVADQVIVTTRQQLNGVATTITEGPFTVVQAPSDNKVADGTGLRINLNSTTAGDGAGIGFKSHNTAFGAADTLGAAITAVRTGNDGAAGLMFGLYNGSFQYKALLDEEGDLGVMGGSIAMQDIHAALQLGEHPGASSWSSDYHQGMLITRDTGTTNPVYFGLGAGGGDDAVILTGKDLLIKTSDETAATVNTAAVFNSTDTEFYGGMSLDHPGASVTLSSYEDTAIDYTAYKFERARGSVGTASAVTDNDVLGAVKLSGHDGTGHDADGQASISAVVDGSVTATDVPTELIMRTSNSGATGTATERLRIKPDGKVGINKETPVAQLHIGGRGAADNGIKPGDDPTCSGSADEGTIRTNNGNTEYCDGSNWVSIVNNPDCTDDAVFHEISTGADHTCAIYDDGQLVCWGEFGTNRLGNDATADQYEPRPVKSNKKYKKVSSTNASCAITEDGTLECWGREHFGQQGNGPISGDIPYPSTISSNRKFKDVMNGGNHGCGIEENGQLWCWGRNDHHIPNGLTSPLSLDTPQKAIYLPSVRAFSHYIPIAVDNQGDVWVWGTNHRGQQANGTEGGGIDYPTPTKVSGISNVVQVEGDGYFSSNAGYCALQADGTVWCWGSNYSGQLGDGTQSTTVNQYTPQQVPGLTNVIEIERGEASVCALKDDGTVWCWGRNATDYGYTPAQITGITTAVKLGHGGDNDHYCVILEDGGAKCWGNGGNGKLGQGIASGFSKTPVDVVNPRACNSDKYVFVTSEARNTRFMNGIDGADNICQLHADRANLPGRYMAWLGTDTQSPATRFNRITSDYKKVDGTVIANGWDDLTDGTIDSRINVDENGNGVGIVYPWTNVLPDGTTENFSSGGNCSNYDLTATGVGGSDRGNTNQVGDAWTNMDSHISCTNLLRLYCFQQ